MVLSDGGLFLCCCVEKSDVSDKKFCIRVDDWVSLLLAVKGGKQDFLNQSPGIKCAKSSAQLILIL